jgi:membrane protein YdbS with pleckstrin-like domain
LRPPRNNVDPRAVRWWTVRALLLVAPLVLGLAIATALASGARLELGAALAGVAFVGGTYVVVMPRWRYRVHRWETTEAAVYTSSGWLRQEWRVAPMSRIQTVDTVRGPLQQLFGLSGVTVTTASAAGAVEITGLDHLLAAELVDRLTETTQAAIGDAT